MKILRAVDCLFKLLAMQSSAASMTVGLYPPRTAVKRIDTQGRINSNSFLDNMALFQDIIESLSVNFIKVFSFRLYMLDYGMYALSKIMYYNELQYKTDILLKTV